MAPASTHPTALLLTSQVAGSRVGGSVAGAVLARAGIVAEHVPTVIFGRHPGHGAPGGGPVPDTVFQGAIEGLVAHHAHLRAAAILTGYFASPRQVEAAAALIDTARSQAPGIRILVDPILGDGAPDGTDAGLYIQPETASTIADLLIPRADLITPNAYEAAYLAGRAVTNAEDAADAARTLGRAAIVTSVPAGEDRLAVVACDESEGWVCEVERWAGVPHGTGDLFAALALRGLIAGHDLRRIAGEATAGAQEVIAAGHAGGMSDLPILHLADVQPARMRRLGAKSPAWVMGLDGCKGGWAGVLIDLNGVERPRVRIFETFQSALDAPERAHVIAVDMPIGFEDAVSGKAGRACERAARALLGPRRSSIFPSPLRPALAAKDYAEALRLNRAAGGPGLSKQAFHLLPKIREIDAAMRPALEGCVHETHPETGFAALNNAPMAHPKRTREGQAERRAVLEAHGFDPGLLDAAAIPRKTAAPDDLTDAAVCALTARRIAEGEAKMLPADPPRDGRGLRMAIFA